MPGLIIDYAILKKMVESDLYKRIFIVTGKESYALSGAKEKIESILPPEKCIFFNDFTSNPKIYEVLGGIDKFKNIDLVVAIGGGSVIDIAKAINAIISQDSDMVYPYDVNSFLIKKTGKPLVAIPTTSGTGSEATRFATIYSGMVKHSLNSMFILPDYIILDHNLTKNTPKYIIACTAMDALCHAIESCLSINSTKESDEYAKKSLELILQNILQVVNNPSDENRKDMMQASYLSGKAINITETTMSHAISYPITSHFNVSHGHAVALTIGEVLQYNDNIIEVDCNDKRGTSYVKNKISEINNTFKSKNSKETKEKIKDIMKGIGLECCLKKMNILDLELIANKCIKSNRLANNPRKAEKNQILSLLKSIY